MFAVVVTIFAAPSIKAETDSRALTVWMCQMRSIVADPNVISWNLNKLKMRLGNIEEAQPLKCTVLVDLVAPRILPARVDLVSEFCERLNRLSDSILSFS